MIPSIKRSIITSWIYYAYVILFFVYLFGPLAITAILAFNDNTTPSFPWRGFTLDWFFSTTSGSEGVLGDERMISAMFSSLRVAFYVTLLSTLIGTMNAFLFERENFIGKQFFYLLMLLPLVIPGVILGIAILAFAHICANFIESIFGRGAANFLRPGFWLVVLGQLSFIATLTTLMISARLRKFDMAMEEAAMDLGANRAMAIILVTLRFLSPSIVGAAIISLLFSFENFNTTYFLTGPDPTLPVMLYSRLRFGITPEINAVSVILMAVTGFLGLSAILSGRRRSA
jgi:spermidine/putrescine transport system permease protein